MKFKSEIARIIMRAKALEFTEFKHPGLGVSLYNVDFSFILNFPDLLRKLINLMSNLIRGEVNVESIDYFGGILTKGVVLSSILAYRFNKPMIIFNSKGVEIYGGIRSESRVLIIDDVIMTGGTLRKCIRRIRERIGGEVGDVVVALDRMCGGREMMESMNVKVHALASIVDVAEELLSTGELEREQYEVIIGEVGR